MSQNQITLSLEGLPEDNGAVKLRVLIHELQTLNSLLLELDRQIAPKGRVSGDYKIADLRRTNPTELVISGSPKDQSPDRLLEVFSLPFEIIDRIESGETQGFNYDLLERLGHLVAPVGRTLKSAILASNGHEARLTRSLHKKVEQLLEPTYSSFGFIQGRLEAVNVHQQANTFRIYPRVGPQKVSGRFPQSMSDVIGEALGRDVIVYGVLEYRSDASYAHAIIAESIEIIPEDESLPDLRILPDVTEDFLDGLSSEEWLRKRRQENEDQLLTILGS